MCWNSLLIGRDSQTIIPIGGGHEMRTLISAILLLVVSVSASVPAAAVVTYDYTAIRPGDRDLSVRELQDEEVKDLTLVELRLLRAGVFARRGHVFETQWVREYFKQQPWYRPRRVVRMEDLTRIERANVERIDGVASSKGPWLLREIRQGIYAGNRTMDETDRIEIALTYEFQQRWQTRGDDEQVYRMQDLRQMDRVTLSILRNGIFARRGRPFQNPVNIRYFRTSEIGYFPNPRYTDALLTPTDWRNITLIRQAEDEKGGPLQDVERYYPTFGG